MREDKSSIRAGSRSVRSPAPTSTEHCVIAPLRGVLRWFVSPGTMVAAGSTLAAIESMKLEVELRSPQTGVLTEAFAADFDDVSGGDIIGLIA